MVYKSLIQQDLFMEMFNLIITYKVICSKSTYSLFIVQREMQHLLKSVWCDEPML